MAKTYEAIATTTLGSAAASYTFTSIPSTYTDLICVARVFPSSTSFYTPSLQFNSDTASNYSGVWLYGQGSSAQSNKNTSQTQMALDNYAATPVVGYQMTFIVNVFNYNNTTTFKTVLTRGNDIFSSTGETSATIGLWRKTPEAINTMKLIANGANFDTGSTFTLYGIKAA